MSPFFSRSWLAIAVRSLTGSVQFYQTLLGDGAVFRQIGKYVEFDLGDLRLGLFEPKPEAAPEFDQRGHNPMSLCLAVADLDQTLTQLTAQFLLPDGPPEIVLASHGREVYLFDPDGNRIILYESKKL
jgi:predicted enzyme related to lactoylglutathione lyase